MFVEKVKTEGLAHLSYLVADGAEAAVVDPRRDAEIYMRLAHERGCRITHVLETHRNEDLVSGAAILARATGARVLHGPNAAGKVAYAETVREGDTVSLGRLRIRVLETPGHTDDSVSYVLSDTSFSDEPVGVFTGDTLFIGDVGRTDFYPDRAKEVAGLLFDSLRKLLALGDQTIVWPAHGAGSVCGDAMADREFSTVGFERRHNSRLGMTDRRTFVAAKVGEHHDQPPYFRRMEVLNLEGAGPGPSSDGLPPLVARDLAELGRETAVVDLRSVSAFQGAHVPDSLAIPADMVAAFAGWLLEEHDTVALVADDAHQARAAALDLGRIGYDRIAGFLASPFPAWATEGRRFRSVPVVGVEELARRVAEPPEGWTLLDVRSLGEVREGIVAGARHVYVGELPGSLAELDPGRHYTIMCESGARATIAASVLLRAGFAKVDVFVGSMGAWQAAGHPTVEP